MSSKEDTLIDGRSISALRVIDLKSELEQRGLSKSGSKKELTERLKKQIELERSRESADNSEEHVPNSSLNDDGSLVQNDFIREYLASQQAAYQKEKEAKKNYEKGQARESESAGDTTQDEEDIENASSAADASRTPEPVTSPMARPIERSTPVHPKKRELSRIASEEAGEEGKSPRKSRRDRSSSSTDVQGAKEVVLQPPPEETPATSVVQSTGGPMAEKQARIEPTIEVELPKNLEEEKTDEPNKEEKTRVESNNKLAEPEKKHAELEVKAVEPVKKSSKPELKPAEAEIAPKKPVESTKRDVEMEEDVTKDKKDAQDVLSSDKLRKLKRPSRSVEGRKTEEVEDKKEEGRDTAMEVAKTSDEEKQGEIVSEKENTNKAHSEPTNELTERTSASVPESSQEAVGTKVQETRKEEEKRRDDGKSRRLKRERPSDIYVPPGRRTSEAKSREPERPREAKTPVEAPSVKDERPPTIAHKHPQEEADEALELNYGFSEESEDEKNEQDEKKDVNATKVKHGNDEKEENRAHKRVAADTEAVDEEPYKKLKRPHQGRPPTPPPLRRPKPETVEKFESLRRPKPETMESPEKKIRLEEPQKPVESPPEIQFRISLRKLKNFIPKVNEENVEDQEAVAPSRTLRKLPLETTVTGDLLQNWYPDVTPQQPSDPTSEQVEDQDISMSPERPDEEDMDLMPNSFRRVVKEVAEDEEKPEAEGPELPEKAKSEVIRQSNRSASLAQKVPVRTGEIVSPAVSPPSSVLSVMNLTRPFTVNQLKELLGRTGQIVEGGFWMDKIKSRCLVEYTSEEEATATREALHEIKWPASNPKLLFVDFSTKESLENHLAGKEDVVSPPPTKKSRAAAKEEPEADKTTEKRGVRTVEEAEKFASALRQWDVDKVFKEYDDEIQRRDRGYDDDGPWNYEKDRVTKKGSGEMLDVLFKKTKTKPHIYYLPLTEEQIAAKEKKRQQILAERERHRAELEAVTKSGSPTRRRPRSPSPDRRRRSPAQNGRKRDSRSRSTSRRRPSSDRMDRRNRRSNSPQRKR